MSYCPNKNTEDFKKMSSVLGDKVATDVWFENQGQPIWNTKEGNPSKLYAELQGLPGVSNDEDIAMAMKSRMYTKSYKKHQAYKGVSIEQEPTVTEFLTTLKELDTVKDTIALYKKFNLVDKNDPNKPIKWSITDANYKKILGIVQNINSGSVASAKIIKTTSGGKAYYTIALTSKNAFTSEDGERTAYFDAETGSITFTDKGLTAETVVHEFSHPFIDAISKHNPELFKNLIDEIKQDSKIPEIKKILDHVDTHYADAGSEIKDKELLAYTISEYGRGNIDVSTGKNTANAIKKFYKWVSDLAKELQSMLRAGGTVYVDAIHPKTKYRDVANLFTVMSEVGTINLGVESKKITPVTDASKAEAKKAKMAAKRAARRKEKGISPNKLVKTSTSNFVDIKNEADHLATLLPKEIAIKLSPGYLKVLSGGRAVVGMFQDSMVHLSQTGPKGTAYHEGFHAVFRTLLEGKEQSSLIKDIKSVSAKPLPKDILDLEMQHDIDATEAENIYDEEILADAFAEYMDGDIAFQYPKGVLGFFQQLKDWLNHVFFNTVTTQKLFRDIKLGKYAKRKPNITRGVAYKVHPVFTNIADVNQITKELASVAFKDIRTIDDLRKNKISIELIEQRLLDSQIEAEDSGNTDLADNIDSIFDEDGEQIDAFWVNEIDSYLRNSLGLKPKPHKATTAIDKIVQDTDDYQEANDKETSMFKKASYEVSGKVNATAAVKFMVAMTPSVQLIDPSKPATISNTEEVISPLTGLPVLVDYGTFYNDLESTLSNIVSVNRNGKMTDPLQDMISTLKVHAQHKPEMLSFATKIEESEDTVATDVFATFSRQKGRYLHHQIKGTSDMNKVAKGEMPLRSDFTTGTFNEKSGVILDGWISSFNRRFGIVDGNTIIYNKSAIDDFFIKRYEVSKLVEENAKEVDLRDGVLATSTIKAFERLLASLGVDIDARTIDYIITSKLEDVNETEYHQEYSLEFGQLFKQFMDATNGLMLKEGDIFGDNNQIQDNKSFFKQTLANADGYFKKVSGESSFVGPGGNTIYTYQANDSVSKIIGAVKQGDLTHINRVLKSAYGKNSVWAKAMVDQLEGQNNIDAFETVMYGNLKSEKTLGDKGAKASELKPIDAYMDNVNKTMSGYFIGLAEADKSRQTYFTGMPTEKIGLSIKTEDGKKSYAFNNKRGYEILKGYLADELSRMDIAHGVVYGDPDAGIPKKDESKWTIYYHYYPVAPGTGTIGEKLDKIPGNAFNSFLFPDIDLKKHGLQNEDGSMIARGKTNFDNNEAIKGEIIRAFGKLVTDELLHAEAIGLIQRDKTGELYNKLISSSVTEQYTQGGVTNITRLMGDYVLNSIIGNIEQTKLFNGDPANYKVKGVGKQPWKDLNHFSDLQKRVPAIFAAGTDFRIYNTKDGVPVVPQNYTSATIANIEVPSAFFGGKSELDTTAKGVFNVVPKLSADKKATSKSKIATKFIGHSEGIDGSTASYAAQAGEVANTGEYTSSDIVFVSVPGKRGNLETRKANQTKTIKEAIVALESGATILTDNKDYTNASSYNEGEVRLLANLEAKNYFYSEINIDGNLIGVWSKEEFGVKDYSKISIEDIIEKKKGRTFQNEELHQAYIKGGLPAVTKIVKANQAIEARESKQLAKEVDLLMEFEELHNKENKTNLDNDKLIELYTALKNSNSLDFEEELRKLGLNDGTDGFNMENMKEIQEVTGMPMADLKDSFKAYLEINQTDAQAWITLDVYKERMLGLGKWSDAHEGAYQKAVDGQNINATELKLLAQPLKTVHAELVFNENAEMIMHYNKQSEAVLLPFMKDMEIGKLLKAMENKNNPVGHVIVLDGKKAGASGIEDIIGADGNIKEAKDIKMNAVQLSYNNLFLQQDLTPHGIDDTLVGSQASKNVLSVVKLDGEYFHDKNGQEVVDIFHKSIGRLSDLGLIELDKAIGYDPVSGKYNTTTDQKNTPVHQLLQKEFEGEASENHINAMDDNIVFDSLPIKDKIMSKLMSIVTKRTVKLKQPGGALIQLSDLGMIASETKLSDKVKNGIIWFKDPATKLNPMHAKDGSIRAAQILMPHGQIVSRLAADKAMVKIIEQKFGTSDFKELTHTQIKSLLSPEILEGFSYRIPNQGASSNDAFEIVGILPQEMGDTMIAFSDITMKTGSDFDIDKAFVVVPNFYVDNSTGKIEKIGYDINDIPNMEKKSLQNLRLDLMRQMLMHPSAYTSVMAPLDNDGLEKFIKELYPEKTKLRALEYFTGRFQLGVKSTFDGAKALVGSIANHMTHHSLALADNLYFEDYYLGKGVKVGGTLDNELDTNTVKRENVKTDFVPANEEQTTVISEVFDYLDNFEKTGKGFHVISGKAGTGKTTVVAEIIAQLPAKYNSVGVSALSNKATTNLAKKVDHVSGVKSGSVAYMLGMKMDPETGEFSRDPNNLSAPPAALYDILIVDEASMINEEALELLTGWGKPIIFLGDKGQLPPIRKKDSPYEGLDSPVFKQDNSKLHERVRQGEYSPILPFADFFWNNSRVENAVNNPAKEREDVVSDKGSLVFGSSDVVRESLPLYKKAIDENKPNLIKTVVYRNQTRNDINQFIRKNILDDTTLEFQPGELLMFNAPFGVEIDGEPRRLDNSLEVQVKSSIKTVDKDGFSIYEIEIEGLPTIPTVAPESKVAFNAEVSRLFKIASGKTGRERKMAYATAWAFKDKYAVLDYAYAITAHKSQGSTYNTVIVHENDIMSVSPIDNKAKSQAIYTAITRASETAVIIDGSKTNTINLKQAFSNSSDVANKAIEEKTPTEINRGGYSKSTPITNKVESNISNKIDELGGNVGATLNAYMNAIVDAAKDPFIVRANLNLTTANTTFMLVRAGVDPKWIASFIGQPAIKAIVDAQNAKEGRFGEITKDKSGKILSPIEVVLAKYGLEGVSEANFRGGKEYKGLRNSVADDIIISTDKLGSEIASGGSNELQLRVLKQFLEWQSKASELNDVVKVSKADVEGATKSLITAELAVNLLHRVIDSKAIGNVQKMLGIYKDERTGLLSIPQDEGARMTGRYFNNSVLAARERFSGLFLGGSKASLNAVKDIAKLSGYETLTTGQTMEEIALSITSNVYTHAASKTRLFNISPERLHSILYGRGKMAPGANAKLSIGARVEMAKASDELKDNLFIQALQVRPGRDGAPDNVYMPNNEVVKETKDSLFYAWEQLIAVDQSEDSLGRDLVLYSFFTSGFSKSVGDFSEHIPYTYLKSQGFPQDMAAMNLEYNDNSHKLQSEDDIFFKNMYADNKLVPTVHKDAVRALNKADASKFIVNTDYAFAIPQLNAANYSIGTSPEGDHVFKRYVKRKIVTKNKYGKDVVDFYLFKRVGYTQAKAAMYVRVNTLGISGGGNNVTEYIGDGNTSIFPKNNVTLPNDLQQLVEASYKKSELTGEEYINKVEEDITDFTSEDRVLFCIMQS